MLPTKIWAIIAAVIILVGLIGGLLWQTKRLGAVQAIAESQTQAIQIYAGEMEKANNARAEVENAMQAARTSETKDLEVFTTHDLKKDLEAKPGLVAARVVNAYNRLFGALEASSNPTPKDSPAASTRQPQPTTP